MNLHLTKRAAFYCAAVICMLYALDLVQGRDPWNVSDEGLSAMLGIVLAAVMIPFFFAIDLVRYFRAR